MSAWVIGLAAGAAYLVNKNAGRNGPLEDAKAVYNSGVTPSTDGATSK